MYLFIVFDIGIIGNIDKKLKKNNFATFFKKSGTKNCALDKFWDAPLGNLANFELAPLESGAQTAKFARFQRYVI